ncbi:MAG: hypothetical protein KatS3mg015_1870 [Fimbriimonadales bacterium]|nr:MAG: hypothetical protein KatS3mg015_1870 [Fimbriimonadales bacterium]
MPEALKCYVVLEGTDEVVFECHFEILPEVGDVLIHHEGQRYEIVKRLHHLNSRGWTDHYTLIVKEF